MNQAVGKHCSKYVSDMVIPHHVLVTKKTSVILDNHGLRLNALNQARKIGSLSAKRDNTSRLIEAMQKHQSPQLKLLMNNHFTTGGSMNLFVSKLVKSSKCKQVGNNQH